MKATYVDHMGSDLTVANAARVSFSKKHMEFDSDRDTRLIRYLAKHNHWTPFGHPQVTFHFEAPIFVARQLVKHQVGLVWNEVSRRYVDTPPKFYYPKEWRSRPEGNIKQGSGGVLRGIEGAKAMDAYETAVDAANALYEALLRYKVAPEQARMILPQSMYTEWYWTGSLASWARVYRQRTSGDAQQECREIVEQIGPDMESLFPVSWEALVAESP